VDALLQVALQGAPNPSPGFSVDPVPFIVLSLVGFVVGVYGHIIKARPVLIVGIGMIFLGTFILPLFLTLVHA
jgi:hypothetical protein